MSDITEAQMNEYRASNRSAMVDAKGRTLPEAMTERDLLEEMVLNMRGLADMLEEIGKNPMLKAMMPKGLMR